MGRKQKVVHPLRYFCSQFRVDNHDVNKAEELLKKYAIQHNAKYFVSKEIGLETGKPHLQGWCWHTSPENSYRQHFGRQYPEFDKKNNGKCFTPVKDWSIWCPYIIKHISKPHVSPDSSVDYITNYTKEEHQALYDQFPEYVPPEQRRKGRGKQLEKSRDKLFTLIEQSCVTDDVIDYPKILQVLINNLSHYNMIDEFMIKKKANAYALKLEAKYPENTRARSRLYSRVCQLDDSVGIFQTKTFSYLKFENLNKNGGSSYSEYESDDCESDGIGS